MEATSESINGNSSEEYANINWDQLGFDFTPTDYMYTMTCSKQENFSQGTLAPYGNIQLNPAAGILNYGQGLIEGLKAYRREDGHILLFQPEQNGLRMKIGAERLCMPSPSIQQFVEAVKQTVLANKKWVPPAGKGSLYIRPLLMGSGPILAMGPAPEYTFLVYVSPVGNFHKTPLSLIVEDKLHRATPGGTGGIKAITNYSPVMKAVTEARANEFSDILFLDAVTGTYIEELSGCNVFMVKENIVSTPSVNGNILPGITRKSILQLAFDFGYQVEERNITVEELLDADEVFCTGTAVVVTPVGSITCQGRRVQYRTGAETVTQKLHDTLTGIQTGRIEDKMGWTILID